MSRAELVKMALRYSPQGRRMLGSGSGIDAAVSHMWLQWGVQWKRKKKKKRSLMKTMLYELLSFCESGSVGLSQWLHRKRCPGQTHHYGNQELEPENPYVESIVLVYHAAACNLPELFVRSYGHLTICTLLKWINEPFATYCWIPLSFTPCKREQIRNKLRNKEK